MANRTSNQLSAKFVANTKVIGNHLDGDGLYLQVREGSRGISKSWIFRYQLNKKVRDMGFGALKDVSLQEARVKLAESRKLLLEGKDPLYERNLKKTISVPTFWVNRYQYPRHLPTSLGTAAQIVPEKAHRCNYGA